MTPKDGPKKPPIKRRRLEGKYISIAAAAVLVIFLVGWAGYGIHAATHPAKSVTVEKTFTGTISIVGNNGTSGCVKPDSGGRAVCSIFYPQSGHSLHQGDKVHAAHETVHFGAGDGYDLLLIYTASGN